MKIQKIFRILFSVFIASIIVSASETSHHTDVIKKHSKIWKTIKDTTWRKDNNWAGEGYVFYLDNHESIKCIHQIYGSGVYAMRSSFVEISIIDDNHLKLADKIFKLKDDKHLISNNEMLKLTDKKPNVYGSTEKINIALIRSGNFDIGNLHN